MLNFDKMLETVCDHCDIRVMASKQEEVDSECQNCWFAPFAHEIIAEEDDIK